MTEVPDLKAWPKKSLTNSKRLKHGEISQQDNDHVLKELYQHLTLERQVTWSSCLAAANRCMPHGKPAYWSAPARRDLTKANQKLTFSASHNKDQEYILFFQTIRTRNFTRFTPPLQLTVFTAPWPTRWSLYLIMIGSMTMPKPLWPSGPKKRLINPWLRIQNCKPPGKPFIRNYTHRKTLRGISGSCWKSSFGIRKTPPESHSNATFTV